MKKEDILVSCCCCDKLAQTKWLSDNMDLLSYSFGDQNSEVSLMG